MEANEINDTADNTPLNTNKDVKISVRVSRTMLDMIALRSKKLCQNTSKYLINLVERDLEKEAHEIRLAKIAKQEKELKIKEEYSKLDKKLKNQRGDFRVDEAQKKMPSKEEDTAFKALVIALILFVLYFLIRWLHNRSERQKYNNQLLNWYSSEKPTLNKAESNVVPHSNKGF